MNIKPQEAEVVCSIYDMYLSGMGRLKIVRALNDKGICRTFNLKGKALCASKQIPEDILLPIVQEVYDGGVEVDRILVQPGNVLEFILANGNVITRTWKDHSRRESWTPEKREQARQKMMRYHNERRACANE